MFLWSYLECIYKMSAEFISDNALIQLFLTFIQQNGMIIDNMTGEWGYFFVFINSTKWME